MEKPFPNIAAQWTRNKIWENIWSFAIILGWFLIYFSQNSINSVHFNNYLMFICDINELCTNISIILIDILNSNKVFYILYKKCSELQNDLGYDYFCFKRCFITVSLQILIPVLIFFFATILEFIISDSPFILFLNLHIFLLCIHTIIYLNIILSLLKKINDHIMPVLNLGVAYNLLISRKKERQNSNYTKDNNIPIRILCQRYDEIGKCLYLLAKANGFKVFVYIFVTTSIFYLFYFTIVRFILTQ